MASGECCGANLNLDGLPGLIESSAPNSRMAKLSPWPTN